MRAATERLDEGGSRFDERFRPCRIATPRHQQAMQSHHSRQQQVSPREQPHTSGPIRSMHDVFSDPCRSAIMYHLQEAAGPVEVREVAEQVTTWCQEIGRVDGPDASTDCTRAWLLHSHVLEMAEFGLVDYDPADDTVWLPDDVCITVDPPWDDA